MRENFKRKLLAGVLSACMIFQTVGTVPVYAEENAADSGLSIGTNAVCTHHLHDENCGYSEGTPCNCDPADCELCNPTDSGEQGGLQEQCSCGSICTDMRINADCPVCGKEGADLSQCREKAEVTGNIITGFAALPQSEYTLTVGADEEEIADVLADFPETVTATASDAEIDLAVTWESDRELTTDEAGRFTYIARLSDEDSGKYDLAEGVKLPQITVTVGDAVPMLLEATTIVRIGNVKLESGKSYVANQNSYVTEKTDETTDYFDYTEDADAGTALINVHGALSLTGAYSDGEALLNIPVGALEINATGDGGGITIRNTGTGDAVSGTLTAAAKGDIYIANTTSSPTLNDETSLTSQQGKITVEGGGGPACSGSLTAKAKCDISISSEGSSATLSNSATLESDIGSVSVTNKGVGAVANSEITATACTAVNISAKGCTGPVITGSQATLKAPMVNVIGSTRGDSAAPLIAVGSVTVSVGAKVCLTGGGASFTIQDTDGNVVTPIIGTPGDVSSTGLDLSKDTPTAETTYTAGGGTIAWEPTGGETVTGGTLTVTNAAIDASGTGNSVYGIKLPNVPVTVVFAGTNSITATGATGAYGLYTTADTTLALADGSSTTITANNGFSNCFAIRNGSTLTIQGSGTLVLSASGDGGPSDIYNMGTVTLAGGTLSGDSQFGIHSVNGKSVTLGAITVPTGKELKLTEAGAVTYDGNTTVNGTLVLPNGTDVTASGFFDNFTGAGTITVAGAEGGADKSYTTDGTASGGDVTEKGIDLSVNTPVVKTVYTAGKGTIVWEPTVSGETVTGGTLTLENITMDGLEATIFLPKLPVTVMLKGKNKMEGKNGIMCFAELTIEGTANDSLTCLSIVQGEGAALAVTVKGCVVIASFTTAQLTLKDGGRFNGIAVKTGGTSTIMTVYGDCTDGIEEYFTGPMGNNHFSWIDRMPGSTLTLNEAFLDMRGSTADDTAPDYFLEFLDMTAAGARIVNNNYIILPTGATPAQIKSMHLTGTGEVRVATAYDADGVATAWDTYSNTGVKLHVSTTAMDFTKPADEGNWKADATLEADGYHWDNAPKTLTLKNFSLTARGAGGTAALNLPDGSTLLLEGANTVENALFLPGRSAVKNADEYGHGVSCAGDLTVSGGGSLTVTTPDGTALLVDGALTIKGGTIYAHSSDGAGIVTNAITITGGIVTAMGEGADGLGIFAGKNISITGGTVTAQGILGGIFASDGSISISGGTVNAKGARTAIYAGTVITLTGMRITKPAGAAVGDYLEDYGGKTILVGGEIALDVIIEKIPVTPPSGGDGGGGGSSSGGDTTVTTPPSTTKTPNPPTQATATVKPIISGGTAAVTVPVTTVNDAIAWAKADAKKNGKTENGITVEIKADTGSAENLTVNLSEATVDALVAAGVKKIRITSGVAAITLNLDTLKEIQKQASADATMAVTKVDNSTLSAEAKKIVGDRPIYDLSITGKNGVKVTGFGKGRVSVSIPYSLGANEKAGNVVAYYIGSTGKAQEMPNSVYDPAAKTLSFVTDHFSRFAVGYKEMPAFTDVKDHWAKNDIEFVVSRGMFRGTSATTFNPDTGMTHGMFVTALGRLAGIDSAKYKNAKFTDVKADAYYASYVAWAAELGITSGTTATTFSPDKTITRQELATLMVNYAKAMKYTLPKTREAVSFADNGSIASWAAEAVKTMQMAGVMNGKNENKFDPTGTATRAEVAAVLHRYVALVTDPATAQGLNVNDSGSAMMYESGKLVKSASRKMNGTSQL